MPTLDWIGKKAVENHHKEVPYRLLRGVPELSAGEPGTGNLLVQGDNLEALKALLPYYAGKVKCIYIDPPYNTGNENWAYNDAVNSPEMRQWLGSVVGRDDLSRHDKWLCMMYPRLALLREFLTEDGIILVSIDENEHHFLEIMLDELFGRENRIESIIWKKSYGGGSKSRYVVNLHEYVLVYAKAINAVQRLELPPSNDVLKYYKYRDDKYESRGPYRLQPLATTSMDARPNLRYPIYYLGEEIWPEKQWQWSRDRVQDALANKELVIEKKRGKWSVNYKQYLKSDEGDIRKGKPYSIIDGVYTQQGTAEIKGMFGDGKEFDFPKPTYLIQHLLSFSSDDSSLIMDSFAGSGTTAHAVLKLNRMDDGHRQFIIIEMDPRICKNVTMARLRMAIEGYDSQAERADRVEGLGGGFNFCELGETLFNADGTIRGSVTFSDLAHHVFFTELREPLPGAVDGTTPLLGVARGTAVYLLYNGVLKDKRPKGGNVLTMETLRGLPPHDGPKVVYGTACTLGAGTLRRHGVTFRQIPYEVKSS